MFRIVIPLPALDASTLGVVPQESLSSNAIPGQVVGSMSDWMRQVHYPS